MPPDPQGSALHLKFPPQPPFPQLRVINMSQRYVKIFLLIMIRLPSTLSTNLHLPVISRSSRNPQPSNYVEKRRREHSTSPKVHHVSWSEKKTRRGTVLAPTYVSASQPLKTPAKQQRSALPQNTKPSHQKPISKGISEAMSLPPIPAPEILAPKRDRRGKVWDFKFSIIIY